MPPSTRQSAMGLIKDRDWDGSRVYGQGSAQTRPALTIS